MFKSMISMESFPTSERVFEIDYQDDKDVESVGVQVSVEQGSSCLEFVLRQDRKLRDHHTDQQRNLELNSVIVEDNRLSH